MTIIMTSREFNQGSSSALKVAETEPVYVTKRGKITNVILSYEQYQKLMPQEKELNAAEYFAAVTTPEIASLPDEIFDEICNPKRDVESWGVREVFE